MRWIRFAGEHGPTYATLESEMVHPIRGTPFGGWSHGGAARPLAEVQLLIPVVPGNFYAAGMNYGGHARAMAEKLGTTATRLPETPAIGYRSNNALIAHGEPIRIPRDAPDTVQYEGEIVAVIGKAARNVPEAEALSCVFGYTIGNDVSERTWQKADRTFWRAKNSDTFKPMGPWIETDVSLDALETTVRVNGAEQVRFATNDMVFGIATFIAAISRYITLHPGDVMWMGTDGAGPHLQHGDLVEIEIDGIGTLRNPVIRET